MSDTAASPGRPIARVNPPSGPTFGDVVSATSRPTSKVEESVKTVLREAGFRVAKGPMGVVCHHPDKDKVVLTLTPDIVLRDLWLAVEVDPCGPVGSSRGYTHAGEEEKDRLRNDLLAAVGWTVIRLRLGAAKGNHIGDRDVVVESSGFTKAAQVALLEAIDDFTHQRPPRVRFAPKGKTPTPTKRRSHVVNIGPDRYSDDTYWFTWYPNLDSDEKVSLRLAAAGRYLYRGGRFVAEVGLHQVDQTGWKTRLTDYLTDRTPADLSGTTKWPWGDTLLTAADPADPAAADIIRASDHDKQTIDRIDFWFTVSGDHIATCTPHVLHRADQTPLVTIHSDAIAVGYRFADVTSEHGYRGPYQRLTITRGPSDETDGSES